MCVFFLPSLYHRSTKRTLFFFVVCILCSCCLHLLHNTSHLLQHQIHNVHKVYRQKIDIFTGIISQTKKTIHTKYVSRCCRLRHCLPNCNYTVDIIDFRLVINLSLESVILTTLRRLTIIVRAHKSYCANYHTVRRMSQLRIWINCLTKVTE